MATYFYMTLTLLSVFFCSGCSTYSFSKAVYDGVQTRDQLQSTPSERATRPAPLNYQQYDSERKR